MDEAIELKQPMPCSSRDSSAGKLARGVVPVILSEEQKAALSRELGITVDGDLFDPRFDYVFKRIFTADGEKSKKALISFLNAALKLSGNGAIADLTVINAEIPVDDKRQKRSVFDIRVKFKNDEQAIIEMQFSARDDFRKRSQFLISKAYASQELSGEMYRALKKRYLVCVTNFTLFPNEEVFVDDYMFRNSRGVALTDDQNITFIELSKIDGLLDKPTDDLTDIEMWSVFLRYASDKDKREVIKQILSREEGISMAAQILETISKDEKEQMRLFDELLYEADLLARERYVVRVAREEAEENKAMQIARNFKRDQIPLEVIMRNTGLSLEVLQTL